MANGFDRNLPFVDTARLRRIRAGSEFRTKTATGSATVQAETEAALSVEAREQRLAGVERSRLAESKRQADENLAENRRQADQRIEISNRELAQQQSQFEAQAFEADRARKAAEPSFFEGLLAT
ncbi:hypothetical protein LCGC14_1326400 [marine sediment metagenome]|uniref:Uncharacterized protein n=1 Tax=marine sediment metagenome TaxID=412755 RepID=A0A0F9NKE3_9ZZZZ